jgi:hypothetical protein
LNILQLGQNKKSPDQEKHIFLIKAYYDLDTISFPSSLGIMIGNPFSGNIGISLIIYGENLVITLIEPKLIRQGSVFKDVTV